MATYERTQDANHTLSTETYTWVDDNLYLSERGIYGSSRLGMKNENRKLTKREFTIDDAYTSFYPTILSEESQTDYPANFEKEKRKVGEKFYELSNHLNNVLEVVTDRKIPNALQTGYESDIVSYSDYYPYGMVMPGRNGMNANYRFSFQGQEKDNEIKGENNSINYKYRMHDPRIGRFFAVDPLAPKYPHNSPYAFSENRVIDRVELEGLENGPTSVEGLEFSPWSPEVKQQYLISSGNQSSSSELSCLPSGTTVNVNNINYNHEPTGGSGYTTTVDPYAGAKIEPFKMHPYDGNFLDNSCTLFENSLGGTTLNLGIGLWNDAVDIYNGNGDFSFEALLNGFKTMGINASNGLKNFTFSDLGRWETYELPFAVLVTGGITSFGRSSLSFTSSTRIRMAPNPTYVFYTNGGGSFARWYATQNNMMHIGLTPMGRIGNIIDNGLISINIPTSIRRSITKPYWETASYFYAKSVPAGGKAIVFTSNSYRVNSIWTTIEQPILINNGVSTTYKFIP